MVPVLSSVNPSSEGMEEPSSLSKSLISHNIHSSIVVVHYFNSCTIHTTIYIPFITFRLCCTSHFS